jgi:DNA-directed RNA polymerase alpha subunit
MNVLFLLSKSKMSLLTTVELQILKILVDNELKKRVENKETPLADFKISLRALCVLRENNIKTLKELSEITASEIKNLKNIDRKTLLEIIEVLALTGCRGNKK